MRSNVPTWNSLTFFQGFSNHLIMLFSYPLIRGKSSPPIICYEFRPDELSVEFSTWNTSDVPTSLDRAWHHGIKKGTTHPWEGPL